MIHPFWLGNLKAIRNLFQNTLTVLSNKEVPPSTLRVPSGLTQPAASPPPKPKATTITVAVSKILY